LVVAVLDRLAPLTPNELAPVTVAVMLPGNFSMFWTATTLGALAVPTPADTSAVPIVTIEPKFVTPELLVKVPIVLLVGLNVPPFTSAVPRVVLVGLKVPPTLTVDVVMLLPLVEAVPPETVRLVMVFVLLRLTEPPVTVATPRVAAEPTVVRPPLELRVPTPPPTTPSTPLAIVAVPTVPPLTFSTPLAIVAEPTVPPPMLSRPPLLLIVAAPTLVAALPKVTLPPLTNSAGVVTAPAPAPPLSVSAPPASTLTLVALSEPLLVSVREAVAELLPSISSVPGATASAGPVTAIFAVEGGAIVTPAPGPGDAVPEIWVKDIAVNARPPDSYVRVPPVQTG
jgi:hypothetical protein